MILSTRTEKQNIFQCESSACGILVVSVDILVANKFELFKPCKCILMTLLIF